MRQFIDMDERAQYDAKGAREVMWCMEFIQHLFKASQADDYPNPATRSNVADKMRELLNYSKHSNSITLEMFWEAFKSAFMQVNSGDGEDFDSLLDKL